MAILSGGPNSGFSGKAGSVVGYYRLGKWVIRGLPKHSPKNKEGSALQNVHRGRFAQVQEFLHSIIRVIRLGFSIEAKKNGNTAHNSATSWNMLHAFDENGELDYSKVRVSAGILEGVEDAAASFADGYITFTWRDNSVPPLSLLDILGPRKTDQVMLVAYHPPTQKAAIMVSGAWRSACRETLRVHSDDQLKFPSDMDHWHTWIAFAADDRGSVSNSQYLGVVVAS